MKNFSIPSEIFRNRNLAVLESLVTYMKDHLDLSYAEIADALNRDDRTIWTVYYRVRKKNKNTYNVSMTSSGSDRKI